MDDPPPLSAPPVTLAGIGADTAATLARGIVGQPALFAIVLLNICMVAGWVWLFVQVSKARTSEMHDIIQIMEDCMRGKSP